MNAPYIIEKGEVNGKTVQLTIRAVEGSELGYNEVREATRLILDHLRKTQIHTVESVYYVHSDEASQALTDLVEAYNGGKGRISPEYLAHLANAYEALLPEGRGVSSALADALGKPVPTVKGHIMRARREGYLSEALEGREGGESTELTHNVLARARELSNEAKLTSVSLRRSIEP